MARLKYVVLVLNSCILVHGLEYVGNPCIHNITQQSGKCVWITQCPTAISYLKQNHTFPHLCGFEGKNVDPVVCCVDQIREKSELSCDSTPRKDKIVISLPGRSKRKSLGLSEKKCEEYVALPYVRHRMRLIIAGGKKSRATEFPHMAALGYEDKDKIKWQCGGSLISQQHILTAAHCLHSIEFGEVKFVRLGDLNLETTTDDAEPQDFRVIQNVVHPGYNPPNKYHDIAILKLDRPVRYSIYVRPACLHTKNQLPTCHLSTTGWGALESEGSTHDHLQNVILRYYTNANCQRTYRADVNLNQSIVDDIQICAGGYEQEKDACQGDSGGPLQYPISRLYAYYIVGVTSFGKGCGTAHIPGVYTRVSHYVPWIEKSIWS